VKKTQGWSLVLLLVAAVGCGSETPAVGAAMTAVVGASGTGAAAGGKGGALGPVVGDPPVSEGVAGKPAMAGSGGTEAAGSSTSSGRAGMSAGSAGQAAAAGAGAAGASATGSGGGGAGRPSNGGSGGATAASAGSSGGMGLAGADGFAGMMTAAGTCSGSTPHGCFTPAATNATTCPKQMPELGAEFPPLDLWDGCPSNGLKCFYEVPGGSPAWCNCDLTVHWLCDYPECTGPVGDITNPRPLETCKGP